MKRIQATINLSQFRANIAAIGKNLPSTTSIMAILKANAYGHGASKLAPIAIASGVKLIGLATLGEVQELIDQGISGQYIYLLAELAAEDTSDLPLDISYTLYTHSFAARLNELGRQSNTVISVHVKVDTGMHRLGLPSGEALGFIQSLANYPYLSVDGIMTHMADADHPENAYTTTQLDKFNEILSRLRQLDLCPKIIHAANSATISNFPNAQFTMVRAGLSLYNDVLSLHSSVAMIKSIKAGDSVGYDCRYVASSNTQIAVIAGGYGDGIVSQYTNGGSVLIHGKRYPIVGKICMDYFFADVGQDDISAEDPVTLIGRNGSEQISANDVSKLTGLNVREISCLLGRRVTRSY